MSQVVTDIMTELLCVLVDVGLITEDDVEEPVEIALDLELVASSVMTVEESTAGGVPPSDGGSGIATSWSGGMPPLEVVELFATRMPFELGGLSIVHEHGGRGWWFALSVEDLRRRGEALLPEVRVEGLNAHITLFYLRSDEGSVPSIVDGMVQCVEQMTRRRGRFPVDFTVTAGPSAFSNDWLAMMDILVACPAHEAVCTEVPM